MINIHIQDQQTSINYKLILEVLKIHKQTVLII